MYSRYKTGSSRIERELESIARKYSDYSSVTSKVSSMQSKLREVESIVRELYERSESIGSNLTKAAKLYAESEKQEQQLIASNKLKTTSVGSNIINNWSDHQANVTPLETISEAEITPDYSRAEYIVISSTAMYFNNTGATIADTGNIVTEELTQGLGKCEFIEAKEVQEIKEQSESLWDKVKGLFEKLGKCLKDAGIEALKVVGSIACGLVDWCVQFLTGTMELICIIGMWVEDALYFGAEHGPGFFETGLGGIRDIANQTSSFYEELAPYKDIFKGTKFVASIAMLVKTLQEVLPNLPTILKQLPETIKNIPEAVKEAINTLKQSPNILATIIEELGSTSNGGLAFEGAFGATGEIGGALEGGIGVAIGKTLVGVLENSGVIIMEIEAALESAIVTVATAEIAAEVAGEATIGISGGNGNNGDDITEGASKTGNKLKPSNPPNQDAVPKGTRTKISKKTDEATRRSLERENEAAGILAREGYEIEQNPKVDGTSRNPDYRIEDELADCYSPDKKTSVRNIASTIEEKVIEKGQANRVVLNLKDWNGNIDEIVGQLTKYPIEGLDEVIVITKENKVISIYP